MILLAKEFAFALEMGRRVRIELVSKKLEVKVAVNFCCSLAYDCVIFSSVGIAGNARSIVLCYAFEEW